MRGSYFDIPKAILYLLKGDYIFNQPPQTREVQARLPELIGTLLELGLVSKKKSIPYDNLVVSILFSTILVYNPNTYPLFA